MSKLYSDQCHSLYTVVGDISTSQSYIFNYNLNKPIATVLSRSPQLAQCLLLLPLITHTIIGISYARLTPCLYSMYT